MSFGSPPPTTQTATTSYDIYGTLIGGFCRGPLHTLTRVEVNNEVLWEGALLRSASTNPVQITIPNRGVLELYWGTEDQVISAWLAAKAAAAGHIHPPYRGLCFVALKDFLFGRETYAAPNIRLSGLRAPVQSLIAGDATTLLDGQANPWVALAEVFTDPLGGLGHPLALFDAPSWQAAANACISRAAEVYVSLRLADRTNARELAANILAMCRGWVRPQRGTGLLEAGMWPAPNTLSTGSLPVINSRLLMDDVEDEPETWEDVRLRTVVAYQNRTNLYKSDLAKYDDPRARRHGTSRTPLKLDLPIVRPEQAATQARLIGRLRALPGCKYTATYRGPALPDLQPGSHVMLDIDATPGGTQILQPCRVLSVAREFDSRAHTAQLEAERTLAPIAYTPADEPGTPAETEVPAIANLRFFELSPQAADGDDAAIALLAQRPEEKVTELLVYYDSIESLGATYPLLARFRAYALKGTLHTTIDADDTTVVVDLLGSLDRELADAPPGAVAARNDTLLLFIVGPLDESGGGYNRSVEILSILDLAATGTDQLTLTAYRARLGTLAAAATAGAEVWIAPRASLPWFRHADFQTRIASGETCYFKLQPATANRARPLDDITPVTFRFNTTRAFAPVITPSSPEPDSGEDFTSVDLAERVAIAGAVSDVDGNLDSLDIVVVKDGVETSLLTRRYGGVDGATYACEYTPEVAGIYEIVIRATDSTGRTVTATQILHVALSTAPRCAEPTFENESTDVMWEPDPDTSVFWYTDFHCRIRCATAAVNGGANSNIRIKYAVVPVGTAVEAVTWTDAPINENPAPYSGTSGGSVMLSPVVHGENYRIWAKAVDTSSVDPLADSYPVYFDSLVRTWPSP